MSATGAVTAFLERLEAGEIPTQVRLAAARGALPLPPADLLRVQARLALRDGEAEVREAATATLRAAEAAEIAGLLAGDGFSPEAAEFYASSDGVPTVVLAALARNADFPDELVARLASSADPELIEELLLNQVRLGRAPEIVDALDANAKLTAGQRTRLGEIRKHLHAAPVQPAPVVEEDLEPEVAAEMLEAMRTAEKEEERLHESEPPAAPVPTATAEAKPDANATTYQRILNLSPGERVKLAFKGSAEERTLLIRDPNRVVATSVLKSPRTSDKDIENYVKMRSLSEEIMRTIGSNREWLRRYTVVLGLIRNPKTPPRIALQLIHRIKNRDLNILGGDRNIAEAVRQQARKAFVARTQGRRR